MKNIGSRPGEKIYLLSGNNVTNRKECCPVEVIILTVLLSLIIIFLIWIDSKNGYSQSLDNIISKDNKKTNHESLVEKGIFKRVVSSSKKGGNDECKRILALQKNSTDVNKPIFSDGSVYFIKDDAILTDQEACALESVLLKYPNQTHLIELLCNRPKELIQGTDFIKLLQDNYENFQTTSVKGSDFFKNTPIEGCWKCDDNSALFEAKVLTLWLYGGAVMSFDVLLNTPDILNYNGLYLSPYVIVSNKNCHSFLFKILKKLKSTKKTHIAEVLKKEIGNHNKMNRSSLVKLIDVDNKSICDHFSSICPLLLTEELKKTTAAWTVTLTNFCPIIMNKFVT